MDPESPDYEGSETRDFSGTCGSYHKKKTTGKGKKKKTTGRKCDLQKGHECDFCESWQFPDGFDNDDEPWKSGFRVRKWE